MKTSLPLCAAWSAAIMNLCVPSLAIATSPNDVLRKIAESWTKSPDEEVSWVDTDINGDGLNDLLVTTASNRMEDESRDYAWLVFAGNKDGSYTKSHTELDGVPQSVLQMRTEGCWVGYIPELKQHGLLHIVSGTGGQAKCQIKAVTLNGAVFTEVGLGEPVNAEENFERLNSRLQSPGRPVTNKAPAAEVKRFAMTPPNPTQPEPPIFQSPKLASGTTDPPTLVQPPALKNAPEAKTTPTIPSEKPDSSTPWSIIVVLIVAALVLLWLLVKKRK